MGTVYKDMNADIKAFKVFGIKGNRLVELPEIVDIHSYNHQYMQLHHFIKAQSYKRNEEWYKENGIQQKLILLPALIHEHLESPIFGLTDKEFFNKYRIERKKLLFNKKEWIREQTERRMNNENFKTKER